MPAARCSRDAPGGGATRVCRRNPRASVGRAHRVRLAHRSTGTRLAASSKSNGSRSPRSGSASGAGERRSLSTGSAMAGTARKPLVLLTFERWKRLPSGSRLKLAIARSRPCKKSWTSTPSDAGSIASCCSSTASTSPECESSSRPRTLRRRRRCSSSARVAAPTSRSGGSCSTSRRA